MSEQDEGKVYVGNLSFRTTEEDIRAEFKEFGEISDVTIIMNRDTGQSRGFGFITFYDKSSATAAIEADKSIEVGGRALRVQTATKRGGGGGGGGYSSGGRRGGYSGGGGGSRGYEQSYGGGGGGYSGQRDYSGQRGYGGRGGGGNRYGGGGGYGDGYDGGAQW